MATFYEMTMNYNHSKGSSLGIALSRLNIGKDSKLGIDEKKFFNIRKFFSEETCYLDLNVGQFFQFWGTDGSLNFIFLFNVMDQTKAAALRAIQLTVVNPRSESLEELSFKLTRLDLGYVNFK